jgi:hypothetical protein
LEGKKVLALGHVAQCRPHSSWWASDNSCFIILMSIVKKWCAKKFYAMCNFLSGMQTRNRILLHHAKTADVMYVCMYVCLCDGGLLKNVISQSDRSTRATCNVACLLRMTVSPNTNKNFSITLTLARLLPIFQSPKTHWKHIQDAVINEKLKKLYNQIYSFVVEDQWYFEIHWPYN